MAGSVIEQELTESAGKESAKNQGGALSTEGQASEDEVLEVFDEHGAVLSTTIGQSVTGEAVVVEDREEARSAKPDVAASGSALQGFVQEMEPDEGQDSPAQPSADAFGVAYEPEVVPGEEGPEGTLLTSAADVFEAELSQPASLAEKVRVLGSMAAGSESDSEDGDFSFDVTPSDAGDDQAREFLQRLAAAKACPTVPAVSPHETGGSSLPGAGGVQVSGVPPSASSPPTSAPSEALAAVQAGLAAAAREAEQSELVALEKRVLEGGLSVHASKQTVGEAIAEADEEDEESGEEGEQEEGVEHAESLAVGHACGAIAPPPCAADRVESSSTQVPTASGSAEQHAAAGAGAGGQQHDPPPPKQLSDAQEAHSEEQPLDTSTSTVPLTEEQQLLLAAQQFEAGTAAVLAKAAATTSVATSQYTAIRHGEAARYLMSSEQAGRYAASVVVKPAQGRGWWASLTRTGLKAELKPERLAVFGIAKVQYDAGDQTHIRMMHTLYRALTGSHLASPTWTVVGFQNDDFVTDLRGVGMLGPLQMLMFAQEHQHFVTKRLLLAEGHPQWYPFAVQSLNMTLYALQALRAERLNTLINKAGSVLRVLHQYYCAVFVAFMERFFESSAEGAFAGSIGQDAAKACAADPAGAIAQYEKVVMRTTATGRQDAESDVKFSMLD